MSLKKSQLGKKYTRFEHQNHFTMSNSQTVTKCNPSSPPIVYQTGWEGVRINELRLSEHQTIIMVASCTFRSSGNVLE